MSYTGKWLRYHTYDPFAGRSLTQMPVPETVQGAGMNKFKKRLMGRLERILNFWITVCSKLAELVMLVTQRQIKPNTQSIIHLFV